MAQKSENQAWLSCLRHTTLLSIPLAIEAAMELKVFDILSANEDPLSAKEIVSNFKSPVTNPNAHLMLDRLLHLLTLPALGSAEPLLKATDDPEPKYSLLPPAHYFIKDEQGISMGLWMLESIHRVSEAFKHMPSVILEGGDGFRRAFGHEISHHVAHMSSDSYQINLMSKLSAFLMSQFLEIYQGFNDVTSLVDVGGNTGSTLMHILDKYPNLKGINFDQPHVVSSALTHPRMEHIGGDMLESIPSADAAFLKLILHDWSDEECIKILCNCKAAIHPQHGKVIVVESNASESAIDPILGNQLGVLFMASHGSKFRTFEDYMSLGSNAGFSSVKLSCVVNEYMVLEYSV